MEKKITFSYLALSNLKKKPYRTAALLALIALSSALFLASLILTSSLKNGVKGIQSRIGADLMIVPEGSEQKMEGLLLNGTPNYFYMDKDVEKIVAGVEGVEKLSSQVFLATLTESCCDFPVQIIGFNPESDFILQSWAKEHFNKKLIKDGQGEEILFAGCNIEAKKKNVKFFGQYHKILSKLAKSGSGMDNVIYADMATLKKIYLDAREKGYGFLSGDDFDSKVSVIYVKLAPGERPDSTALRIMRAMEKAGSSQKVQIIQSQSFISDLMGKLSSILVFLYALCFLVLVISLLTLSLVFSLSLNERLREFSILRVLGASHKELGKIIFDEALILAAGGGASGIFISLLIILPFNFLISEKIALPFAMSGALQLVVFSALVFVLTIAVCLLSSAGSVIRIFRFEPYGEVK
ncbi:MAG: ABC transporter permease [Treponema sp.]|nr:ABC transporter permease [Treponema sp.]